MCGKKQGTLIVVDGLDGSGKATQCKILKERMEKEGHKVYLVDFPQYGKKSAGMVEEYLTGKYGSADEVTPYQASIFYACDRFDKSFEIKKWLSEGAIVLCDRYVDANVGHQGGKIKDKKERKKFIVWLYKLEYGIFKIPMPNLTIFLETTPEISEKLTKNITDNEKIKTKEKYLKGGKEDIHEKDKSHLSDALDSYRLATKESPDTHAAVKCTGSDGTMLPIQDIHERIWSVVKKNIYKN